MRNDRERSNNSSEVDLIEILGVLWGQRLLILCAVIVCAGASIAYAVLATPIYEARIVVQPPTQNDIAYLNFGRGEASDLPPFKVGEVYNIYLENLKSESLRRKFFREVYLSSLGADQQKGSRGGLYRRFSEMLNVAQESRDNAARYVVSATSAEPEKVMNWVVLYAQMAGEQAKQAVLNDAKGSANAKANNIQQQITSERDTARQHREDRIALLQEALKVSRKLGLEVPSDGGVSRSEHGDEDGSLIYLRGSMALEAEIQGLQSRPSDDPFIENLRQKQAAVAFYRTLQLDVSNIAVYRQDGDPEVPDQPIKPRRLMIVLLGLVLGGLVGVVLAFGRHFQQGRSRSRG